MILERLTLHDFGVYKGRQEVDLTPESPDRPIILVGARNGRGKTTILDAINLVLYGARANLSNRLPRMAWEEYLRSCIHRGGPTSASIGLVFSVVDDFGVRRYEIARTWSEAPRGVNETFTVILNGERDDVLAEDWNDHLEGLLPLEIASLNFFDGEKTDELATPEQSREVIRSAIRGLLGLGILERLEADLKVLIRRKQDEAIGETASEALLGAEAELSALLDRRASLVLEVAEVRTSLERAYEELRRQESKAREVGVDRWEQRAEIEAELGALRTERTEVEQQLQIIAAGAAPLMIAEALLARAETQVASDLEVQRERLVLDVLVKRDEEMIAQLPSAVREPVHFVMNSDRRNRQEKLQRTVVHARPEQLGDQIRSTLAEAHDLAELATLVARLDLCDSKIADTERKLMGVPTDGQLMPILEELGRLRGVADSIRAGLEAGEEEMRHLVSAIERLEAKVSGLREAEADRRNESMQDRRSREYAVKALDTLTKLAQATVARNVAAIEASILESFRSLVGKSELITRVRLSPDTLEMVVDTAEGERQSIERLSAGERQLFAVAILWGLSRVAKREVPLVVDTPLGRLDNDHRKKLSTNYFPHASRQVIILSTDEEFDLVLRSTIENYISREYLIEFDDAERASTIKSGYFVAVSQ
jgi:DNA sulfur modification protein DndD